MSEILNMRDLMSGCSARTWRLQLLLTVSLLVFSGVASGQGISPIRERGMHTLYGDIKVESSDPESAKKSMAFEVQLYIINGTIVDRQTVPRDGRYRFMDLRNGEYEVVVNFENTEVARTRVRVEAVYKNDFRQDIVLELRTDAKGGRPGTVSAADFYKRTTTNEKLFLNLKRATDEKRYDEAIAGLQQLLAADPKDFQAWSELGTVFLLSEKPDDSEKAYLRSIAERPTFFLAHLNLGRLRSLRKNFEGAIEPLSEAVKIQPDSADANYYLGEAYLQVKKGSKAVPYLNEAAKLGRPEAHLRLAVLYDAAKLKDRAAAEYEQFLQKRPDYADRKKLQQYIADNKKN